MGTVLDVNWALAWIETAAAELADRRDELNELDRRIGDGDHGENLARGFASCAEALAADPPRSVSSVLKVVATTLMSTVGGASGPLYGTAFLRASKSARHDALDSDGVVSMLQAALDGVRSRGRASAGEKTMVDAWEPALAAARAAAAEAADGSQVLVAAADAAREGAEATEAMLATKGRASYLGERSLGHRDPGAESTSLLLAAAARAASARVAAV